MSQQCCVVLTVFVLALAALPTRAYAWVEAQVQTARARVSVERDTNATVELALSLRVRRGWLEGLELTGFDPGLELIELDLRSEEGERFEPRVRVRESGSIELAFHWRQAPRSGRYRLQLRYRARLPLQLDEDRPANATIAWTLPSWRAGLDDVTIVLDLPKGAIPTEGMRGRSTFTYTARELGDRTELSFTRPHLPRTLPWTVAANVPIEQFEASIVNGTQATEDGNHGGADPASRDGIASKRATLDAAVSRPAGSIPITMDSDAIPFGATRSFTFFVLVFALLAAIKMIAYRRRCLSLHLRPNPWIALPWQPLRLLLVALLCIGAASSFDSMPQLALFLIAASIALSVERTPRRLLPPAPGVSERVTRADFRRARLRAALQRLSPVELLDATKPLGSMITVGAFASLQLLTLDPEQGATLQPAHAWLLLPALLATQSSRLLPPSPEQRLLQLRELLTSLQSLTLPCCALELRVHRLPNGEWIDVRARLRLPHESAQGSRVAPPKVAAVSPTGASSPATCAFPSENPRGSWITDANALRIELAIASRPGFFRRSSEAVMIAEAREDSEDGKLLARLDFGSLGRQQSSKAMEVEHAAIARAPGGRLARILPLGLNVTATLDAYLLAFDEHSSSEDDARFQLRDRSTTAIRCNVLLPLDRTAI